MAMSLPEKGLGDLLLVSVLITRGAAGQSTPEWSWLVSQEPRLLPCPDPSPR